MASIVVHLIVLTVFGFIQFSPCRRRADSGTHLRDGPIPAAKVSRIRRLIETAPIIPKPKITKPTMGEFTGRVNAAVPRPGAEGIFKAAKPGGRDKTGRFTK